MEGAIVDRPSCAPPGPAGLMACAALIDSDADAGLLRLAFEHQRTS
jgi:hypothetical protein